MADKNAWFVVLVASVKHIEAESSSISNSLIALNMITLKPESPNLAIFVVTNRQTDRQMDKPIASPLCMPILGSRQ